jgi:hypothetical protein
MKRLPLVLPIAALLAACAQSPVTSGQDALTDPGSSATTSTDTYIIPLDVVVFVSCANGGQGEFVQLSGSIHVIFHLTVSSSGIVSFKDHFQPLNVSGTGLTTGATYHGTGVTQDHNYVGQVGQTFTFIDNFRIIGQGPGNNFTLHENLHVTINANGTVTTFVDNVSATCK